MRLVLPGILFAVAGGLYWLVIRDDGTAMARLPDMLAPQAAVVTGVAFWLSAAWLAQTSMASAVLWRSARRDAAIKRPKLLIDVGSISIYAIAVVIILSQVLGLPLSGVLATSGALAAVIGLAVQKTISDVMAGIALNLEQGFKLGDWIETASGVTGEVVEITWRTTRLVTIEGRMVVMPNAVLAGNQFVNLNAPERGYRMRKPICLEYAVPTDRALAILQSAIAATEGVLAHPPSVVLIDECADNGVVYSLNFWVPDYPASFDISRAVIANALKFLDLAGIAPVYPKLDLTMHRATERRIEQRSDIKTLLHRTPFFRSFDEAALDHLARSAELLELPAGAVVVGEGEPGASLFIVVTGLLTVTKRSDGNGNRALGRLAPGEVFGEMSLLTGAPRAMTVTTNTPTMLLEISKDHLEPILNDHPKVIAELGQLQADRMATNEGVLALWPEERQDIMRLGMAAFLRRKIGRFFGRAEG